MNLTIYSPLDYHLLMLLTDFLPMSVKGIRTDSNHVLALISLLLGKLCDVVERLWILIRQDLDSNPDLVVHYICSNIRKIA